jgi:hypothetical protein
LALCPSAALFQHSSLYHTSQHLLVPWAVNPELL